MKYEWRKSEKELYNAKAKPVLINVESQNFITIKGQGNPNDPDFSNRVSALYALAYGIKMAYKKLMKDTEGEETITDFTVYPLEGIWGSTIGNEAQLAKDRLFYTIMIRQPDLVSEDLFVQVLEKVKIKKPNVLYDEVSFKKIADGSCIQALHIGSYDDEPATFTKMSAFAENLGLQRSANVHREIYLNNAQKTEKSKLKTILRYSVEEKR